MQYVKENDICRYCGGVIKLIPAGAVYGESTRRLGMEGEFVYQCQNCNARVGCHKGTTRALGNVANGEVIEIDDGLKPYYFYYTSLRVIPLPYFDRSRVQPADPVRNRKEK